jgi:hypothetical protein
MKRPIAAIAAIAGAVVMTATSALTMSCGYQPLHGGARTGESDRFTVVLVSTNVADAVLSDEVVAGVRDALARGGALNPEAAAYPRCEVEVLRADEAAEGIAAVPNAEGVALPQSRATRAGVVARAWIMRSKSGPRERDTGDVRAMEVIAAAEDARSATFRHIDGLRAAGRRVGMRAGLRVLGLPTGSD